MSEHPDAVSARNVSISLGGRPVVRQVDLSVRPGELLTLLGTNGSGKSTLVRGLMGLVSLTSGSVELLGTPLPRFRAWRRVGYVPQRSSASSGVPATVREVVTSGRMSRHAVAGWPTRRDRHAVHTALARVEMDDRSGESVTQLSGGQQQRVMIARALATEPHLLVMDEPTAGVDQETQELLAVVLTHLVRTGAAVILVAHELGPLAPLVDRAVVLADGRAVFTGPASAAEARFSLTHDHPHSSQPPGGSGLHGEGMWR